MTNDHTTDAAASAASAVAAIASKTTYGGAVAGLFGAATSNEILGVIGVLIGVAGFLVNWYYRRREFALRLAEHRARMSGDIE